MSYNGLVRRTIFKPRRGALITGGGRGIGRAVAEALAGRGYAVVVSTRTKRELESTARAIEKRGGSAWGFRADVRRESDVKKMTAFALKKLPSLDVLVCAAGDWVMKTVEKTTPREWENVLDTNLTAVYLCVRAVLPHMKRRRRGFIVPIASTASKVGFAKCTAYCASKFGLRGFLESLREEVRPSIRVIGVYPGAVDTVFWNTVGGSWDRRRMMTAEDVAGMVISAIEAPRRAVVEDLTLLPLGGDL